MKITITPVRYQLKRPIFTASTTMFERVGALVSMEAEGLVGWGEALPIPEWPNGDLDATLKSLSRWAASANADDSDELAPLDIALPDHPVAAAAVDCARYDLVGQRVGLSMAHMIGFRTGRSVDAVSRRQPIGAAIAVNGLVGGRNPSEAAGSASKLYEQGIRTLKVKVGADHISADVERLRAIREAVGATPSIRLDANRSWNLSEAKESLPRLAEFDIEYIEEPVGSLIELKTLRPTSPIPLYADELVSDVGSAKQIVIQDIVDGLVLKPAVLGSLVATRELAERALDAGMGVTLTNTLDSGIGTAAAIHVAAAVDGQLNPCGFATGDLFRSDPAPPPRVIGGVVHVPSVGGLGVTPTIPPDVLSPDGSPGRSPAG